MIASLRGTIEAVTVDSAIINVGGVGFQVYMPTSTLSTLGGVGQQARLYTHMAVREDAITLYGFADEETLRLFQMLLSVSGFGPKLALASLSAMSVEDLVSAIAGSSEALLTSIPGVGKKLAGRLILELKDKIMAGAASVRITPSGEGDNDVILALLSMGFSASEASRALGSIPREKKLPLEEKLRLVLGYLGKR
jgi:holliday junction DNA helicase RuvA